MTDQYAANPQGDERVQGAGADGDAGQQSDDENLVANPDDPDASPEGDGEGTPEEELDEVEIDGKTYAVPKAVKASVLMERDYRQKTMRHADEVRQFETARTQAAQQLQGQFEALTQAQQAHGEVASAEREVAIADWKLSQLKERHRAARAADDEELVRQINYAMDDTREEREAALGKVKTAQDAFALQQQRYSEQSNGVRQATLQHSLATIEREIPGYSTQLNELGAFAQQAFGFTPAEIVEAHLDPRMIKVLHLAFQGQKASKTNAVRQKAATAQAAQPARTVSGGAAPSGRRSPDRMSTEEWMAFERERVRKAGKAPSQWGALTSGKG